MANKLFMGLSSLLLPFGLYAGPAQSSTSYQRSYFSASINQASGVLDIPTSTAKIARDFVVTGADDLDIVAANVVHELVVIDAAVPDKQQFYRALKPGVDIVEINSSEAGLTQLLRSMVRCVKAATYCCMVVISRPRKRAKNYWILCSAIPISM